ncbi:MAG: DUF1549 domain-containing protein [Planctomycetes bacterium]|nr:DUF1549 domain-containing protein [Planctomycetota bacterium]
MNDFRSKPLSKPRQRRKASLLLLLWCLSLGMQTSGQANDAPSATPTGVSFRTDVMAVLSKSGCNMGVCHGNKNGKGGFKLSLRGEDPAWDYETLSRDLEGRRINVLDPDASLVLLKATMSTPHLGARRFTPQSLEYQILRRWIASGAPSDTPPKLLALQVEPRSAVLVEPAESVQLSVTASFSDGSQRDVKSLAVYELSNPIAEPGHDGLIQRRATGTTTVVVRYLDQQVAVSLAFVPARPDFQWAGPVPTNFIDELVYQRLKELRINPSPRSSDTIFLRRAYFDIVGALPTAEEARQFINDNRSDKRARLIDDLLERPEFADTWALKWSDLLRVEEKTLDRKGVQAFHGWIRSSLAQDKPLDQFARELIASRGSTYRDPASNYYRAMREPFMRAESTAQVFLGVRLQCARCHSHPFDRWTQDDYYNWANLFARVDYRILENRRRDTNDSHEFDGEQIVVMARQGDVTNPRTNQPAKARFLGDNLAELPPATDRLLALADWLASAQNTLFVETLANRIWFQLIGQGIVDPIDDFRATNPPSNPELLKALSAELVSQQFRLKPVIRTIMNSQVYQSSALANAGNREDEAQFSHAQVQMLTAELRADAWARIAGVPLKFAGYPAGTRAVELAGVPAARDRDRELRSTLADEFLQEFGKPPRLQACECERSHEATLSQTLRSVNGPFILELIRRPDNRLGQMLAASRSSAEIIDELFWVSLSRGPTPEERQAALTHVNSQTDPRPGLEDVMWALMNAREFLFRW